jgi:hypothetical protein
MKKYLLSILAFLTIAVSSFAQNPMDKVGIEHNAKLAVLLSKITTRPDKANLVTIVKAEVLKMYPDQKAALETIPVNFSYENMLSTVKSKVSAKFYADVVNVGVIIDNASDVGNAWKQIEALETSAPSNYRGAELTNFYAFLSTAKYSAKFWMSKEKGGMGSFETIKINNPSPEVVARFAWAKCICCDALGCCCGGIGGPAGAIAGGICSSGCYGIGEW